MSTMQTPQTAKSNKPADMSATLTTWALALAQLVSWGSVYYSFSLLVVPMEQTMGWSRTATNAALSVGLLVSGFAAYPIGRWIDHGLGRRIMAIGSVIAAVMLLLWAGAHSLTVLFVVWIGLGISMAATFYDPVFAVITHRYPRSFRNKITLITLVAGFASTVFIPLTQLLVGSVGWRTSLIVLAALNLVVCLPIHVLAIRSSKSDVKSRPNNAEVKVANDAATRRALRSPIFWALAVCFTAYYATFAALTFHLVPLMVERGVSNAVLVTTMALIGPAQVAARAIWFTFGRTVHVSTVGIIIVTLFPLSTVILISAGHSPALLWLFALCYGAANGMMTILRGTIVQDLMWTEGYGAVSGMLSFPSNVAKGIAPIAAASIWSFARGYVAVEWTVFLVSILSAIAFFVAVRVSRHALTRTARCRVQVITDNSTMKIRAARSEDLDAIAALLAENELPASDVTPDLLRDFAVAEDAHGSVVGTVGLERFGTEALLRSLAVAKPKRSAGLGSKLLTHAEYVALTSGLSELWLLTTTATEFFRRAGYALDARPSAPTGIRTSTQFAQLCPSTAVCMRKRLYPLAPSTLAVGETAKR